jgi:hypothetical protein
MIAAEGGRLEVNVSDAVKCELEQTSRSELLCPVEKVSLLVC